MDIVEISSQFVQDQLTKHPMRLPEEIMHETVKRIEAFIERRSEDSEKGIIRIYTLGGKAVEKQFTSEKTG